MSTRLVKSTLILDQHTTLKNNARQIILTPLKRATFDKQDTLFENSTAPKLFFELETEQSDNLEFQYKTLYLSL